MKRILDYIMDDVNYFESEVDAVLCDHVYNYVLYIDDLKDADVKTSYKCWCVKWYYGLMLGKFLWI